MQHFRREEWEEIEQAAERNTIVMRRYLWFFYTSNHLAPYHNQERKALGLYPYDAICLRFINSFDRKPVRVDSH